MPITPKRGPYSTPIHTNAREGADTPLFQIANHGIGGECGSDDVLAEAPVLDWRAGAFAANLRATTCDYGAVVLTAGDLRHDAPGLQREHLHQSVAVVFSPARENLFSCECAQCADVKAGIIIGHNSGAGSARFRFRARPARSWIG